MSKPSIASRTASALCLLLASFLLLSPATAQAQDDELPPFSNAGVNSCVECHDEWDPFPVLSILKTPHAVIADKRTPFANQQCEACHGPGGDHIDADGDEPILAFGAHRVLSKAEENEICLACHKAEGRAHWDGSEHQRQDLSCTDCHTIHVARDPMTVPQQQANICFDCHQRQRAESLQPSAHPIRQGQMACSDCHQAHGTLNEAMLIRPTLNETCYSCHAEKRGPFLWEHPPAAENCSTCHKAHGSIHPALLQRRAPLLCQECHSRAGHPSIPMQGDRTPRGGRPTPLLLGNSCANCHSQVHGSNHPSGANLSR
jgi:DmsE family decaheme c-type cytochrome